MSDYRYNQYHSKSQKAEVNISKEQLFSYRKRLLFAFAHDQKGATTHDETEREKPRRVNDADPETGCMEFDIEKGRFSFRLTAPYSEERRRAASEAAKAAASNLARSMV